MLEFVALCVACHIIQCALRAAQVKGIVLARIPDDLLPIQGKGDAEIRRGFLGRVWASTLLVAECECRGAEDEIAVLAGGRELGHGQTTVNNGERGAVLER